MEYQVFHGNIASSWALGELRRWLRLDRKAIAAGMAQCFWSVRGAGVISRDFVQVTIWISVGFNQGREKLAASHGTLLRSGKSFFIPYARISAASSARRLKRA